jgi:DNA-binding MarR family transcriptional regulator
MQTSPELDTGPPRERQRPRPNELLLVDAVRRLDRRVGWSVDGALEELGLTTSTYLVLEALESEPRVHAGQLARNMRITRQSMHELVRKLRLAGLILLLPKDLGVRGLELTREGRTRLRLARNAVGSELRPLGEALTPQETGKLLDLLSRCEHAVRPRPAPWWLD